MSSDVRFAPPMPASRAVTNASPFGPPASRSVASVSGRMRTTAPATARRAVTGLEPTSTMRGAPSVVKVAGLASRHRPAAGSPRSVAPDSVAATALRHDQQRVRIGHWTQLRRGLAPGRDAPDSRRPRARPARAGTRDAAGPCSIRASSTRARTSQPPVAGQAEHRAQNGSDEQLEGDERADRVAGQADDRSLADAAERQRLARLNRDAPEVEAAEPFDDAAHVVVLADADAARRDEQVGIRQRPPGCAPRSAADRQAPARRTERLAAGLDHRGSQRRRVRIEDLTVARAASPGRRSSSPVDRIATTRPPPHLDVGATPARRGRRSSTG